MIFLILSLIFVSNAFAIEVAITVDDLPVAGKIPQNVSRLELAHQMLQTFKKHRISKVYGMVNAESIEKDSNGFKILQEWVDAGQLLGNHTFSHMDIVKNGAANYIDDIKKNEIYLSALMQDKNYKIFRYPFLAEGESLEKREQVRKYLFDNGYKIAEVTMDFFDYEWNDPLARCLDKNDISTVTKLKETYLNQAVSSIDAARSLSHALFARDIKYISIIHIGIMNVTMLDEMLTKFEQKGVKFIDLEDALSDPIYTINPDIVRDRTYTFLNQIRLEQKIDNPPLVKKFYENHPEDMLAQACPEYQSNFNI